MSVQSVRPKFLVEWKQGVEHLCLPAQKSWLGSVFLAGWLLFWAWGGGKVLIFQFRDPMTSVWLILWVLGFSSATLLLIGQLTGVDVVHVGQGELVISRRAGLFFRTWRYSIGMIKNLRVDMSQWTGEYADGNQHVPFMKQQWGTVRFDYGHETVHLAPHMDAPAAAQVADWLRPRLPISASR